MKLPSVITEAFQDIPDYSMDSLRVFLAALILPLGMCVCVHISLRTVFDLDISVYLWVYGSIALTPI